MPATVWLLSWVSLLADISGEMMYPLLPLFLVSVLGASKIQVGAIEGLALLVVALMSAYSGWRSDRSGMLGPRRVPWIRWGYGLPVLGKALIAVAWAWPLVLGGRLLDRFGKGLRGAPRDALIADAVDSAQRGRAFGLHRALDTIGALLGVLLSAALLWWWSGTPTGAADSASASSSDSAEAWGYRVVFATSALLGLGSLLLTFLIRESLPVSEDSDATGLPGEQHVDESDSPGLIAEGSLQGALPRRYWYVLTILTLFGLANSSDAFLLLRARELGWSAWAVVLAYALFNASYAALSYPAGKLSDRWGRWQVIAIGWGLYLLVYLGFAVLTDQTSWGVWPLLAAYGFYMALTEGVGKALIADSAPAALRGRAMGLFHAATGVATLLASLLVGFLWEAQGASWALGCSAVLSGLTLGLLWCWRQRLMAGGK